MSNMNFSNAMTPEQNSGGNFECLITNFKNIKNNIHLCHLFTIIDKNEEIDGEWKDKCPTSLDELRPFSLKDRGLVDQKYKDSFPKISLVAIKWKEKKEDIRAVTLRFSEKGYAKLYQIFSYNPEGHGVFCNKDLLNIKKLNWKK